MREKNDPTQCTIRNSMTRDIAVCIENNDVKFK